jgi:FkbM family methyltransferase
VTKIIATILAHLKSLRGPYKPRQKSVTVMGQKIDFQIRSETDLRRVTTYLTKEPETINWINAFKNCGKTTYFDVGANIGIYSLYPAIKYGRDIQIYSFEPMSQNFAALSNNIFINNLATIVKSYCCSIAAKSGFQELFIPYNRFKSGGNRAQFNNNFEAAERMVGKSIIHSEGSYGVSLDDLTKTFNFPIPNYIKIDVDGIELDVLYGAKNVLSHPDVKSVLIECQSDEEQQAAVKHIFSTAGFSLSFHGNPRKASNMIFHRD